MSGILPIAGFTFNVSSNQNHCMIPFKKLDKHVSLKYLISHWGGRNKQKYLKSLHFQWYVCLPIHPLAHQTTLTILLLYVQFCLYPIINTYMAYSLYFSR